MPFSNRIHSIKCIIYHLSENVFWGMGAQEPCIHITTILKCIFTRDIVWWACFHWCMYWPSVLSHLPCPINSLLLSQAVTSAFTMTLFHSYMPSASEKDSSIVLWSSFLALGNLCVFIFNSKLCLSLYAKAAETLTFIWHLASLHLKEDNDTETNN